MLDFSHAFKDGADINHHANELDKKQQAEARRKIAIREKTNQ